MELFSHDFIKGGRVRILPKDVRSVKNLTNEGGYDWNPDMEKCLGLVGVVTFLSPNNYVKVAIFCEPEDGGGELNIKTFYWHPSCLQHCQRYKLFQGMSVFASWTEEKEEKKELTERNNLDYQYWSFSPTAESPTPSPRTRSNVQLYGSRGKVLPITSDEINVKFPTESENASCILPFKAPALSPIYPQSVFTDVKYSKEFRSGRFGDPSIMSPFPEFHSIQAKPTKTQHLLLLQAASSGNGDIIQEFIYNFREHVNMKDDGSGETALMVAAKNGMDNIVHMLCLAGASPKQIDDSGYNSVHKAVMANKAITVKILTGYGDRDERILNERTKDGYTCLHLSIISDSLDVFKTLLQSPTIDFNAQTSSMAETALHLLIKKGNGMIEHLASVEQPPKIDLSLVSSEDRNPLHSAAYHGHQEGARFCVQQLKLAQKESWINKANSNGHTPLHFAAMNGHGRIVEDLINAGGSVNAKDDAGMTPLHAAISFWRTNTPMGDKNGLVGRLCAIWALVKANADLNTCKWTGETAFHEGMKNLKWMMQQDYSFPAQAVLELQALPWEKMKDFEQLMELNKDTPQLGVVLYMLASGADPSVKDKFGKTPIDHSPDPKFQYLWKHFREAYIMNVLQSKEVRCLMCGGTANVVFNPCGHRYACADCARKIGYKYCPCLAFIERMTDVYGMEVIVNGREMRADDDSKELRRKLEAAESAVTCPICMDKKCDMVFSCGHLVCRDCGSAAKVKVCPLCRVVIKSRQPLFLHWN